LAVKAGKAHETSTDQPAMGALVASAFLLMAALVITPQANIRRLPRRTPTILSSYPSPALARVQRGGRRDEPFDPV